MYQSTSYQVVVHTSYGVRFKIFSERSDFHIHETGIYYSFGIASCCHSNRIHQFIIVFVIQFHISTIIYIEFRILLFRRSFLKMFANPKFSMRFDQSWIVDRTWYNFYQQNFFCRFRHYAPAGRLSVLRDGFSRGPTGSPMPRYSTLPISCSRSWPLTRWNRRGVPCATQCYHVRQSCPEVPFATTPTCLASLGFSRT